MFLNPSTIDLDGSIMAANNNMSMTLYDQHDFKWPL
jgi:hypothetical protein